MLRIRPRHGRTLSPVLHVTALFAPLGLLVVIANAWCPLVLDDCFHDGEQLYLLQRSVSMDHGTGSHGALEVVSYERLVLPTSPFAFAQGNVPERLHSTGNASAIEEASHERSHKALERTLWNEDLFPEGRGKQTTTDLFGSFQTKDLLILTIVVVSLVLVDVMALRSWEDSFRNHAVVVLFWMVAAAFYNFYVGFHYGTEAALDWLSGYLLEYLLSVDNLFVFHLIFKVYKTPKELLHKALFFGILGAVVCRVLLFFLIEILVNLMVWVRIAFGLLLIASGIQAACTVDDDEDAESVSQSWTVRFLKLVLGSRLSDTYDKDSRWLFTYDCDGRLQATLLLFVVLCLEGTDVIFAVDSVSAKVAQIPDMFNAYSSSVMAIFGLRALFFVIRDLMDFFELLKYGICIILIFIGLQLILSDIVVLSAPVAFVFIFSVFAGCITASVVRAWKRNQA